MAATNRDFQSAIEAGTFREDLFYRLNVFSITLPPLRKRKEDIPALVAAFCERERRRLPHDVPLPDADALEAMTAYDWPGNVRELQNVIERAAILAGGEPIRREHLPLSLFPARAPRPRVSPEGGIDFDREVEAFERALITQAMKACDNVKARAAKYLGIDRNRLRYKLRQYGIEDGS
ncbi:MAG: sigma-54-dependent Fis family transcriptional regulator [Deltaproteobacteria bacterium]|nr:MAG: sigma-54-dependent Fis family transcriptional regulator [Deltaproteobacteria bacterium]